MDREIDMGLSCISHATYEVIRGLLFLKPSYTCLMLVLESCPKSLGFSQDVSPVSHNSSSRSHLTPLKPYSHWSWFSFYCHDKDHGQKLPGEEKKGSIWLVHPNRSPSDGYLETRTKAIGECY